MELVRKGAAKTNQDFFLPREKKKKVPRAHPFSCITFNTFLLHFFNILSTQFIRFFHCSLFIFDFESGGENRERRTNRREEFSPSPASAPSFLKLIHSSFTQHRSSGMRWDKEGGRGQKLNRWDGWEWKGQTLALAKSNKQ